MFTSARTTSEYSILECPTIRPLKWKSNNIELAPNCPRCASSNTKFCYYNNYSLSQPRYFCKGCRRYWTKGGSLRNVPVGGGCRKSRRSRTAARQGGGGGVDHSATAFSAARAEATSESETGGSGIDLAAVFAKYVSHQNVQEEFCSPGGSCSASSSDNFQASSLDMESQMDDISTMFDYQNPLDLISVQDNDQLQQVNPQISMHEDVSGDQDSFLYPNSDAFELQSILGDELASNVFWAEDSSNFGSQESIGEQIQDFGLFSSYDDQSRIQANLVSDSWGAFDPSGYEIFSRP